MWASLGLYPLIPGTPVAGISTPAFARAVVRSSDGSVVRIRRVGDGARVGAVQVDGAPHEATWLDLGPGRRPRNLTVTTTTDANPSWGTRPQNVPPSYPAS